MIEPNERGGIRTNIFYVRMQEELPDKCYSIDQRDTDPLAHLHDMEGWNGMGCDLEIVNDYFYILSLPVFRLNTLQIPVVTEFGHLLFTLFSVYF